MPADSRSFVVLRIRPIEREATGCVTRVRCAAANADHHGANDCADGEAKFWLTPDVHLAVNVGLAPTQLRQAQTVVVAHLKEIEDAWSRHFGG